MENTQAERPNESKMNTTILTKIKAKDVCENLARILGVTEFEIQQKSDTDLDIAGITLKTSRGTVRFSAGSYTGEFNVHVTIPRKVHRLEFTAYGERITKDFDKEEDLQAFLDENQVDERGMISRSEVEV